MPPRSLDVPGLVCIYRTSWSVTTSYLDDYRLYTRSYTTVVRDSLDVWARRQKSFTTGVTFETLASLRRVSEPADAVVKLGGH